MIEQNIAFVVMTENCEGEYLPNKRRESIICALFQGLNLQLGLSLNISVFKMQAILLRFQLHVRK